MFPDPLFAPKIAKHERHIDGYSNFLENYIEVSIDF
jgi:hypothetical protein